MNKRKDKMFTRDGKEYYRRPSRFIDIETGKKLTALKRNAFKYHLTKNSTEEVLESIQQAKENKKAPLIKGNK